MNGRPAVAAVVALALTGLAACAISQGTGPQPTQATPQDPSSSHSKNPLTGCIEQLAYWAAENLRHAPDQAFDYQHMGLTADKYDELRKIETTARALQAKGKLPTTWVHDQARAACVRILATPAPTNTAGGWPQ